MSVAQLPVAAVIGSPIQQSLSPSIFRAAFAEAGRDWGYVGIEVSIEAIGQAVSEAIAKDFIGLSVTMPFKRSNH